MLLGWKYLRKPGLTKHVTEKGRSIFIASSDKNRSCQARNGEYKFSKILILIRSSNFITGNENRLLVFLEARLHVIYLHENVCHIPSLNNHSLFFSDLSSKIVVPREKQLIQLTTQTECFLSATAIIVQNAAKGLNISIFQLIIQNIKKEAYLGSKFRRINNFTDSPSLLLSEVDFL